MTTKGNAVSPLQTLFRCGMIILGSILPAKTIQAAEAISDVSALVSKIKDPVIRVGVQAAINKNLIPAATEEYYPGFYSITADGSSYGGGATWPGLDSWQMAGAYLLLDRTRLVLDSFEYIRASQRKDGAIPFAIFNPKQDLGPLRDLFSTEDTFVYKPPKRDGLRAFSQETHSWIGLFKHWQPKANPLTSLAPVCFILTAAEIYDKTQSKSWLMGRYASIEAAAKYLLGKKSGNGLIAGSGFYTEMPPRYAWDGVTQCYTIHAFRELARLDGAIGDGASQAKWTAEAKTLTQSFIAAFWRTDHFGEYVHPEHGLVDTHGLSDVNWAAVAFGVVDGERLNVLWPRLMKEPNFWMGGMPTQTVTKPFSYEQWELNEPISFEPGNRLKDVAAMGRSWYLEAAACIRMQAQERLVDSARRVSKTAIDGYWRERYHPKADGSVLPGGVEKYCEYPANLIRVVLGNPKIFCE